MARQVKCPRCGEKLDKEDSIEHKKKYYHEECFNNWQQESQDRNGLIEYICELYKLDIPSGLMLKQIKEFHEEQHLKYKGMELALRYFFETLGNRPQEGTGIGIIPYVYEDAKKHYIVKMKVEESVKKLSTDDINTEKRTVVVQSPKFMYENKTKEIDMSSL
ncbi:hypothetical protein COE51_01470 [Bacillus pseudomycoides]|nr:hypothetical protein COE51_01470 [Bacillus pseudomycoides]